VLERTAVERSHPRVSEMVSSIARQDALVKFTPAALALDFSRSNDVEERNNY